MQPVETLIDKAISNTGSAAKLARAMGVPQPLISMWRSGQKNCIPADRARLAGFAGEDAAQELIRATIEQSTGTRREQLEKVLGNTWRVTGGALHSAAVALGSVTFGLMAMAPSDAHAYLIRCINRLSAGRRKPA